METARPLLAVIVWVACLTLCQGVSIAQNASAGGENGDKWKFGTDVGLALNLINRLNDDEEFRIHQGFSGYWAIGNWSSTKARGIRPILNLTLLDFDTSKHDLELGVGLGFLFKLKGLSGKEQGKGLSLSIGYGRNLFIRPKDKPDYWFFGIGLNLERPDNSANNGTETTPPGTGSSK